MAHAKTSVAQIAAQICAGIAVATVFYRTNFVTAPDPDSKDTDTQALLDELDRECTINTSGTIWGLETKKNGHKPGEEPSGS